MTNRTVPNSRLALAQCIIARVDGVYDDPQLMAWVPLGDTVTADLYDMALSVVEEEGRDPPSRRTLEERFSLERMAAAHPIVAPPHDLPPPPGEGATVGVILTWLANVLGRWAGSSPDLLMHVDLGTMRSVADHLAKVAHADPTDLPMDGTAPTARQVAEKAIRALEEAGTELPLATPGDYRGDRLTRIVQAAATAKWLRMCLDMGALPTVLEPPSDDSIHFTVDLARGADLFDPKPSGDLWPAISKRLDDLEAWVLYQAGKGPQPRTPGMRTTLTADEIGAVA